MISLVVVAQKYFQSLYQFLDIPSCCFLWSFLTVILFKILDVILKCPKSPIPFIIFIIIYFVFVALLIETKSFNVFFKSIALYYFVFQNNTNNSYGKKVSSFQTCIYNELSQQPVKKYNFTHNANDPNWY